jgi:hypothetical protein
MVSGYLPGNAEIQIPIVGFESCLVINQGVSAWQINDRGYIEIGFRPCPAGGVSRGRSPLPFPAGLEENRNAHTETAERSG